MGYQHRRELALGVSPQLTPADGEKMGREYGTGAPRRNRIVRFRQGMKTWGE